MKKSLFDYGDPSANQEDKQSKSNHINLDPNQGIFDKWRLYKSYPFVTVGENWTQLNRDRNICLAAQTSLDRLHSLTETLEQWSGPVSIGKNKIILK